MIAASAPDDRFAAALRGFGPVGIAAILIIILGGNVIAGPMLVLPVGAVLALVWVRLSRTPWREVGLARPTHWAATVVVGVVFGTTFKLLMKAVVMPLLGADPINQAYHFLAGNHAMLPAAVWAMFAAGFGEEIVFRGYAFERLGRLLGSSIASKTLIVLFTAAWFGYDHYAVQGLAGAEQAAIVGLVFGSVAALTGTIWMVMFAHTAFDLTALAIIFWNLETDVAHLIFK